MSREIRPLASADVSGGMRRPISFNHSTVTYKALNHIQRRFEALRTIKRKPTLATLALAHFSTVFSEKIQACDPVLSQERVE